MSRYIRTFAEIGINDVQEVGGKNASLGEMFSRLSGLGIHVPDGFAVTAAGFRYFISCNQLESKLDQLFQDLDTDGFKNLSVVGDQARKYFLQGQMPPELCNEIAVAYRTLSGGEDIPVAVRSSATAEDLPEASFAGQHESYLYITGVDALVEAVQKCFASLYTDRAIKYRHDNGFGQSKMALSVGVQKMVRSGSRGDFLRFLLRCPGGFRTNSDS